MKILAWGMVLFAIGTMLVASLVVFEYSYREIPNITEVVFVPPFPHIHVMNLNGNKETFSSTSQQISAVLRVGELFLPITNALGHRRRDKSRLLTRFGEERPAVRTARGVAHNQVRRCVKMPGWSAPAVDEFDFETRVPANNEIGEMYAAAWNTEVRRLSYVKRILGNLQALLGSGDSFPGFHQLPAIYVGSYKNPNKKKRIKNIRWVKPLGLGLIFVAFFFVAHGLVRLDHWSGYLLLFLGFCSTIGGLELALSEPKAKSKEDDHNYE